MFNDIIHVKNKSEIRYGHTEIPTSRTMAELMKLLKEYECDEILTRTSKKGNDQLAFVYQEVPFLITIPKVYIKNVLNERIGVRLVLYYLEIIMAWAKARIIDIDSLLMGQRMVQIEGKNMTMKEVVDTLPPGKLLESFTESSPKLTEGDE